MSDAHRRAARRPTPPASRRAWPGARSGTAARRKRHSVILSIVMTVMLVYALLPLFWLVVNSTKTQSALFSTFGLWFGGKFALFSNIHQVFTYDNGIFAALVRQHPAVRRGRRGRRHAARHPRRLRHGQVRLPRQAGRLRGRARRRRRPGHRPRGADLPAVQRPAPDQHAVGGDPAVAGQPARPLPDLGLRVRGRADRDCSRRRGSTGRASSAPSSSSPAGCSPPAWSPCCCSPWSRPGTTTSCR